MYRLKTGFLAVAGVALGALTLRTLRQRRTPHEDDEESAAEVARTEARAAVGHAAEAVSHTRAAGEKTAEYVGTEVDKIRATSSDAGTESERPAPVRRLRKVGKGWTRR